MAPAPICGRVAGPRSQARTRGTPAAVRRSRKKLAYGAVGRPSGYEPVGEAAIDCAEKNEAPGATALNAPASKSDAIATYAVPRLRATACPSVLSCRDPC